MKTFALALAAALGLFAPAARAAIVCVAPTANTAGSVTITAPILFNITTAGNVGNFVLDEWVTNDGSLNSPSLGSNLTYLVNNTAHSSQSQFTDNDFVSGSITANDGVFYLNNNLPPVIVGDTVTLSVGTYTIPATSNFNPGATQTFTGNVFVAGFNNERLSGNVLAGVPEPSTWAALAVGAGLAGVLTLRRRRVAGA